MDKKERKCIAVLITKPERKYQDGLLKGITKSAFSHGLNVAVFGCSLLTGYEGFVWGEQKIFDLPDYEKFAGIVYAVDSFNDQEVVDKLSDKMKEVAKKGIPVVAVDGYVEGLPCYFNDDANAVEEVVTHLVKEHGVSDIGYMTGHRGHFHAEHSLKAYRNTMKQLGLEVSENRVYYGDYWYNEASNYINKLENSKRGLPQAIVCANEHMAIAIYKELYKRGVFVPKDILLGCTANDSSTAPYLLTAENDLENIGYEAGEKIWSVIGGEEIKEENKHILSKNRLVKSVSCGCTKTYAYDYSKERGILIDTDSGYFGEFNFGRERILMAQDFHSLFEAFDYNTRYLPGFRTIAMCMCDGWDAPSFLISDTRNNHFTDRMQLYYRRDRNPEGEELFIGEDRYFDKKDIFPGLFDDEGEPLEYVFRSIHFRDRNFGYAVLVNGSSCSVYEYTYNFYLHDVANGMESMCRLQSVDYMYSTDIMTGLYNRNGFNHMLSAIMEESKEKNKQVLIAMADMNCLKTVNDTYGHEEGDLLITTGAHLLKEQKLEVAESEKNFRMGGDEFVKIAVGDFSEKDVQQFEEELYKRVEEFSQNCGKPYRVEMAIGCCVGMVNSVEEMEALMSKADKRMYEEKKRLKHRNVHS